MKTSSPSVGSGSPAPNLKGKEKPVEAIIDPLRSLDWEDIDGVEHATRKAYTALSEDTGAIRDALLTLPERPVLLRLCEHYDVLDKIVLHDDESGVRLRLHVFLP